MKTWKPMQLIILMALGGLTGGGARVAQAATTTDVAVGDNFFSPINVTINANDTVRWTWTGIGTHTTTGPGTVPLWDSSLHTGGFVFTHTFPSAGSFAYSCTLHAAFFNQRGTVTVQAAANVPPSVAISAPTNNAVFAAPWTGTIQAAASDSDGTVSRVDFFAGSTKLGSVANPPANFGFAVTNLAAGSHTLTAVATDNLGATNTSAAVAIQVLTPVPIVLSSATRPSPTSFQFLYTATPGLKYVVNRSRGLPGGLTPIQTNRAASSPVTFLDNAAVDSLGFYSVTLLPNP